MNPCRFFSSSSSASIQTCYLISFTSLIDIDESWLSMNMFSHMTHKRTHTHTKGSVCHTAAASHHQARSQRCLNNTLPSLNTAPGLCRPGPLLSGQDTGQKKVHTCTHVRLWVCYLHDLGVVNFTLSSRWQSADLPSLLSDMASATFLPFLLQSSPSGPVTSQTTYKFSNLTTWEVRCFLKVHQQDKPLCGPQTQTLKLCYTKKWFTG